ncbi:hypothetical protein MHYP_G00227340 [Metynnis hypsauchen]
MLLAVLQCLLWGVECLGVALASVSEAELLSLALHSVRLFALRFTHAFRPSRNSGEVQDTRTGLWSEVRLWSRTFSVFFVETTPERL